MSQFDLDSFLSTTTTEANTRRPPLPVGPLYSAILGAPKLRQAAGKKDPSTTWTFLDVPVVIDVTATPEAREVVGDIAKVTINYSCFFDLTPSGGFDMAPGRNVGLRQLREATGLNVKGEEFSLLMLQGRSVRVVVKHRESDNGETYDEVSSFIKG